MASQLMNRTQQLAGGQIVRLRSAGRLTVTQGRLWLTGRGVEGDVWLQAGESLVLRPGVDLLAEAWPTARFEVGAPHAGRRLFSLWRFFGGRRAAQPACA